MESSMSQYILSLLEGRFGQLLFLGLSKCLPESDFYLPRAIGQVLMKHPDVCIKFLT